MSDRGGVRSSARLSGDGAASAPARAGPQAVQARGRPVSTTAAAAQRRARAAERAAEVEDSPRVLRDKCRRLARALRNAKHLVVYTGAGISTAADIPDYRGPHGVWTRLQRGETVGRVEVSRAQPTFTHMALTALWARGALKFVVSQNCDGLHLRAGLPRRSLAELHGDMFAELCAPCRRVYLRAFDTTERTARHAHGTRRLCHACGQELRDSIVHFGERGRAAWPLNWAGALRHAARADVVLCLGSSLKVLRRYPRLWRMQSAPRARPALYIVNLQWTPKDSVAALKINARCDVVMQQVARRLRLRVPRYSAARDPLLAHAEPLAAPEAHTSRRPALPPPPRTPPAHDHWEPSSPSASDSDEELPLRHLAARLRDSAPHQRDSAPHQRDSAPHQRDSAPHQRDSAPHQRDSAPHQRDSAPHQRDSAPHQRDSAPHQRDSAPHQRDSAPHQRDSAPHQRDSAPHQRDSAPHQRDSAPHQRDSAPHQRDSAPHQRDSAPHQRDSAPHQRDSAPHQRDSAPHQRDSAPHQRDSAPHQRDSAPHQRDSAPHQRDSALHPCSPEPARPRSPTPPRTHLSLNGTDRNSSHRMYTPSSPERLRAPSSPERLRAPSSPDGWYTPNSPDGLCTPGPPNRLHAFQVSMHSGEATILLRAEHAPPPRPHSPVRCRTADLRKFRMTKRLLDSQFAVNGHAPPGVAADTRQPCVAAAEAPSNGNVLGSKLRRLLEHEPLIDPAENVKPVPLDFRLKSDAKSPKTELKLEPKDEPKEEASASDESGAGALAAGSLAAAIIRRAVLLCRASLYPGLHTIIAPAAQPPRRAEPPPPRAAAAAAAVQCAWCARHYAARRCLWYGPARETPPAARVWRRVRGRRYLCACCEPPAPAAPDPAPDPAAPPAPVEPPVDDGGWYGKGYRKGRRRRR